MKIAFLGYGNMAEALASRWAAKHEVFFGGRNAEKAAAVAAKVGHGATHGNEAGAAEFGEVIVLATPHDAVFDAMKSAGGAAALAGKTLIDINNPVADYQNRDFLVKQYDGKSLAEAIAAFAPAAHVVKAFNMCQASVWTMDPPRFDGRKLVTLYCGDDAKAKATVASLIEAVSSDAVDLGELRYAQLLEPAAAIVIKFLMSGNDLHTVLNLIRPELKPV